MFVCIPDVLSRDELKSLRKAIAAADFEDGRRTAGYRAKKVKNNLQLKRDNDKSAEIKQTVVAALRSNKTFQRIALPRSIRPPLISRYEAGMDYGLHVDDALMGTKTKARTDLSCTVFISDPTAYDGGELVVVSSLGDQEVKLPAGSAVVYPSSTLHRVAPVTRGERIAAVTWIQSYVRDPAQREILHDVDVVRRALADMDPAPAETDLAFKIYANLLRMWADV